MPFFRWGTLFARCVTRWQRIEPNVRQFFSIIARSIWLFISVCFLLTAINSVLFIKGFLTLNEREGWVKHTVQVHGQISVVLIDLSEAERGQRGYLLTGDATYLQPYTRAVAVLPNDAQVLEGLIRDNPEQQQHIALIKPLLAETLSVLHQTVQLAQEGNTAAGVQLVRTNHSQHLTSQLLTQLTQMQAEEDQLLSDRRQAVQNALQDVVITFFLGMLAIVGAIVWGSISLHRRLQERERLAGLRLSLLEQEQMARESAETSSAGTRCLYAHRVA